MTDEGPADLPADGEGHDLPGPISDPIRAGEIPAPTEYSRPPQLDETPEPWAFRGSGHGMGAGATRGRDGTIPTVASGTDLPRDRHIAAAARLEQALAAAEQRYVSAADAIFAAIEQFGELGRYDAGLLAWLETEQKNLRDRIFMIRGALKNVRDHLGRL
jgi:hypothetical protein